MAGTDPIDKDPLFRPLSAKPAATVGWSRGGREMTPGRARMGEPMKVRAALRRAREAAEKHKGERRD